MTTHIKTYLSKLIKKDESWQLDLLSSWNTIMGNLGNKMRIEKIDRDTLILGVYDACWMQELHLMSPLLLATINQKLDQPRIKHLRFKRAVAQKPIETDKQTVSACQPKTITLKAHELEALRKIKDPHLGMALRDFLIRCYKERV